MIILRGNSGSGKTTIAKELQNRFGDNTMRISQDVIRRDILKNCHEFGEEAMRRWWREIGRDTFRTQPLQEFILKG